MKHSSISAMRWLVAAVLAATVAACASIGRPQGGPKDEIPPVFVSSNPAPEALNFNKQKLEIYFDENVQLQDAFNKVIVSPVQKNNPAISANGKRVIVELKDTLLPNTTYTVDFGDAIKDLNEGNILDGFTAAFATGDSIDTLRIAGMVLEARTLEPAQGMIVGIYSEQSDTAIYTKPFERVARTNQLGQFTIHNLKPGNYRIYAINDINRDYYWDRTEDVAFYDTIISPYVRPIEVVDTLRASDDSDSLRYRQGTAYYPNDVLLTWFNEGYQAQYLKDYKRPDRRRITLQMAAPADSLPQITVASGPQEGYDIGEWGLLRSNATLDSLEYWIKDTAVLATDSLYLSVKYLRTDTADMLTWRADTLKFFFKDAPQKEKKKKKNEEPDTLPPPPTFLTFKAITATQQEVNMPLIFEAGEPIDSFNCDAVKLEMLVDTNWVAVEGVAMEIDSIEPLLRRRMPVKWHPGTKYKLSIDSAAIMGIYGEWNDKFKHEFTVKELEEYSNLVFTLPGIDSAAVVELLDKNDKVIAKEPVVKGKATFNFLKPGEVYARMYIDSNQNGQWDTGNLKESIQPEEVYYYPKKIRLRKNWDVAQDWNIYEVALDMQKPWDIKQNKPKLKSGERTPGQEDDDYDDYDDEFGNGGYGYGNGNSGYGPGNNNFNNGYGRY